MKVITEKLLGLFLFQMLHQILAGKQIYGPEFDQKLKETIDDALGRGEFQKLIDEHATFSIRIPDGMSTVRGVTKQLGEKFHQYNLAVEKLRNITEENIDKTSNGDPVQLCCQVDESTLSFNSNFNKSVNQQSYCLSQTRNSFRNFTYSMDGFLDTLRENKLSLSNVGWQYFSTEEGLHFSYPARRREGCDGYDPRLRPFYAEASAPTAKDIVVILDYTANSNTEVTTKAIQIILNTTNPNDRIGMITVPKTPYNAGTLGGCFANKLALATPRNQPQFINFLSKIKKSKQVDHGGSYTKAFVKAFSYFSDSKKSRRKLILFITDESNRDAATTKDIIESVQKENKKYSNSVVINTYVFGTRVDNNTRDLLKKLAEETVYKTSQNISKHGQFVELKDYFNFTRRELSSYYNAFADPGPVTAPIITVPYVDFSGLGLVMSLCLPVHDKTDRLRGVTCIDAKIAEILHNVTFHKKSQNSYSFLIDHNGKAIIHPLLTQPSEVEEPPIFMDITALESEADVHHIISSMKNGTMGSKTVLVPRHRVPIFNTGAPNSEEKVLLHYFWCQVPSTPYSFCLVMTSDDLETELTHTDLPKEQIHSAQVSAASCRHAGVDATTAYPVVQFFRNSYKEYPYSLPLKAKGQLQENCFNADDPSSTDCNMFQDEIPKVVSLVGNVNKIWQGKKKKSAFIYWRYLVTTSGVMSIYPGTNFTFNPNEQQWFTRALDGKYKSVLTPMSSPRGNSLMLSAALLAGRKSESNIPIGVIAGEFKPVFFHNLLLDSFPKCDNDNSRCFIIDVLGYILVHEKTLESSTRDHIVTIEPEIARYLVKNKYLKGTECLDYENFKTRHDWKLSMVELFIRSEQPGFELHKLHFSNVFIAIAWETDESEAENMKTPPTTTSYPRGSWQCSEKQTCDCPCESELKFRNCDNSPDNSTRKVPHCPIQSPYHPVFRQVYDGGNPLDSCFICSDHSNQWDCSQAIGCSWCNHNRTCLSSNECPSTAGSSTSEVSMQNTIIALCVVISLVVIALILFAACYKLRGRRKTNGPTSAGLEANGVVAQPRNVDRKSYRPPLPPPAEEYDNPAFEEPTSPHMIYSTVNSNDLHIAAFLTPVHPTPPPTPPSLPSRCVGDPSSDISVGVPSARRYIKTKLDHKQLECSKQEALDDNEDTVKSEDKDSLSNISTTPSSTNERSEAEDGKYVNLGFHGQSQPPQEKGSDGFPTTPTASSVVGNKPPNQAKVTPQQLKSKSPVLSRPQEKTFRPGLTSTPTIQSKTSATLPPSLPVSKPPKLPTSRHANTLPTGNAAERPASYINTPKALPSYRDQGFSFPDMTRAPSPRPPPLPPPGRAMVEEAYSESELACVHLVDNENRDSHNSVVDMDQQVGEPVYSSQNDSGIQSEFQGHSHENDDTEPKVIQ